MNLSQYRWIFLSGTTLIQCRNGHRCKKKYSAKNRGNRGTLRERESLIRIKWGRGGGFVWLSAKSVKSIGKMGIKPMSYPGVRNKTMESDTSHKFIENEPLV